MLKLAHIRLVVVIGMSEEQRNVVSYSAAPDNRDL
jgi:hypothetical protein